MVNERSEFIEHKKEILQKLVLQHLLNLSIARVAMWLL